LIRNKIMAGTGFYWVGQDGNVYNQNTDGTATNQGRYIGSNAAGYEAEYASGVGTRIDDPSAIQQNTPAPTGGSGAAPKVFNQAGAENTQRTIDQIPGLLEAALATERQRYQNTIGDFGAQESAQRKTYGESTTTNQQNYDANFMDSIRSGIKGLGGLMALLRGTGAGGGTAEDLARETVGGVTANDIRGGADTQKENQAALDNSLGAFVTELNRKKAMNEDAYENNQRAVRRDSNTQLQDLFGKMAGFYGDVGNSAESNNWMNRAGALTPEIAANSRTQISAYDTAPVTVKAPELTAFSAPTQPGIQTAPNGQVGSGIFTMGEPRRRRETTPAPVAV